ncbi:Vesicle trafficking between the ER and Golgi [Diaporthe eres]|uniref:Vesicle trafficking between the ER and Golgi n=1 Tax=Diaporthe eres TaxID=83184 RepID=A0ABR1NZT1_DIAER
MAARGASLRDKQIASLKKILNLNEDVEAGDNDDSHANGLATSPIAWKVLVFDDLGQEKITAQRAPIPDVPVVYLLEPNAQNLQRITEDLQKGLYTPAYINFLSSIPRPLLEDFATMTATAETSEQIAHVYDQYLNFIVAEPDLFSLGMEKDHVYWALNSAKTKDEELDHVVDKIVSGLFSVIVTMGVIPIIRASRGAAAEMIAQKLDRKLRDHILNSGSKDGLFSNRPSSSAGTPTSRPVLVLLDRNVDLTPMLSHGWTYQHLVHDVLNMKLNRITIETPVDESKPEKGVTKKAYDLTANDFFWSKNSGLPFQEVAEDIDAELNRYKEESAAITKKTGISDLENLEMDTSASAQHLKAALTVLPELRERKAVLDMHMNILAAILSAIQKRALNEYYSIESNVMKQTKAQILDLIKDKEKGDTALDKLRLFVVWFLSTETDIGRAEWQQFEEALTAAGVDGTCLPYIRQVRATTKMTQLTTLDSSTAQQQPSASSDLFNRFSNISSRLTDRLKETGVPTGALSANFDSIVGGLKNFLPANQDLTITKIVESIMDPSSAASSAIAKTENYLYFDPRSDRARGTLPPPSTLRAGGAAPGAMPGSANLGPGSGASFGQRRQGFSEAVVFTVGGGSMDEYGNLQEWIKRTAGSGDRTKRRIVYGSTELVNAADFIKEELERLGREVQ